MDKPVRLKELSGLRREQGIPNELENLWGGWTFASSLAAETGIDVRSGGIFNVTSMAAQFGVGRQHFENILDADPRAKFFFHPRPGRIYGTYVSSLDAFKELYETDKRERLVEQAKALQPVATSAAKDAARVRFERGIIPLDRY